MEASLRIILLGTCDPQLAISVNELGITKTEGIKKKTGLMAVAMMALLVYARA